MERVLRENNERMLKVITEQLSQTVIANREKGTFPSQPDTSPKGGTSFDSTPDTFRKVNAIITLRSAKKIDNHVGDDLNENQIHLLLLILMILDSTRRMSLLLL